MFHRIKHINNKGIIIVWLALGMLILLIMFAGLAVDIAYMHNVKNQLTAAADAGSLAGAALLSDPNDLTQANARAEAIKFALKNTAAGNAVVLASDGSNTLSSGNDITVGNWNDTTRVYSPGITPVNAVQVRPRRTSDSPGGSVSLFWGKVFGWPRLSAAASAIAVPGGLLTTPALSFCIRSCDITGLPKLFDIQSNLPCDADYGVAWTLFKSDSSIPEKDIEDLIDGTRRLTAGEITSLCNQCVTTNNGTSAINYLGTKFRDTTYDAANKDIVGGVVTAWRVGIVIMNYHCPTGPGDPCHGCPPSGQGGNKEPYHIQRWAKVTITNVCDNTNQSAPICTKKGVVIGQLTCADCSDDPIGLLTTGKQRLVK